METNDYEDYETSRYDGLQDSYNSIAFRLDPTPTLETIRRYMLRECVYDADTKTWKRPDAMQPMFDKEGIDDLMAELYARMSVDKVLSSLEENGVRMIVREVGEVVIEFIYSNSVKYNIQKSDFNKIFFVIKHNIDIFLRRAIKGKENELITKGFASREVVSRSARQNYNNEDGKSSGMNMNPFGR